jgi:hypothetical protein
MLDVLRPMIWNHPAVELWYAQNLFLYVHRQALGSYPELTVLPRVPETMTSLIHPRLFRYWTHPAELTLQQVFEKLFFVAYEKATFSLRRLWRPS